MKILVELAVCWMASLTLVDCQLSVTWNGSTITGPVLIYLDELLVDDYTSSTIGDVNRPGALICRSEDRARVSWHFADSTFVSGARHRDSKTYIQTRTEEGVIPSMSRLSVSKPVLSETASRQNGLWHCRLNAVGDGSSFEQQINVGIYSRSVDSSICVETVNLASSSFGATPPTFTLHADTRGGPPTNYSWSRNWEAITNGGPYNVSIAVNGANESVYNQSRYRSVLTVTGNLPGLYQYSASNRAAPSIRISSLSIEGGRPANFMAKQVGLDAVVVSWTAVVPPPVMGYHVTAEPGGISANSSSSTITLTSLQTGIYNIQVQSLSQHLPSEAVGPVQVTVRDPSTTISSESTSKSPSTAISSESTSKPTSNCANKSPRDVSIAVIVTFILTLILCVALRLTELVARKAQKANRRATTGGEMQERLCNEIYANLEDKDAGDVPLVKNMAYKKVESCKMLQEDTYYAQPRQD